MNPFVRANLKLNVPTIEPLELIPETFEGAYIASVVVHGGQWQVEKVIARYQRGRLVQFRDMTLMVISMISNVEATSSCHPGGRIVTFRAVDLPKVLESVDPDVRPGGTPITIAEKIVRSVEPKFGVLTKRKLIT
jgi:hypothetical protein